MRGPNTVKTLGNLAEAGASAAQVADASVAAWAAVHAALSPVIGARGSAALYKRSLHLARSAYPLLAKAYDAASEGGEYSALRAVLTQQSAADAAAAHDAMLRTFHDLLADLIGRSLTQRLLQAAWGAPSGADAEEDTSQ